MLRHARNAVCAPVHTLQRVMAACPRRHRAKEGKCLCGTAQTMARRRVEWTLAKHACLPIR